MGESSTKHQTGDSVWCLRWSEYGTILDHATVLRTNEYHVQVRWDDGTLGVLPHDYVETQAEHDRIQSLFDRAAARSAS